MKFIGTIMKWGNQMKSTKIITKFILIIAITLFSTGCSEKEFKLLGETTITIEANSNYEEPGYFLEGDTEVNIQSTLNVEVPGTYTITYTAKTGSKTKTLERTIIVVDTIAPVLSLVGSLSKILCNENSFKEEGYSAVDNVDGELSDKVIILKTSSGIKYTISDSSGNLSEMSRAFTIKDTQRPSISLKGPSTVTMDKGGTYYEFGINTSDNCGDVGKSLQVSKTIDPNIVGQYTVTYSVKDDSGNTNSITRIVKVEDLPQTTVYLTFDDGPFIDTISILDTLKKYEVKATFFILYHRSYSGPVILREVAEGHTIGLHSWSHKYSSIYASETAYYNDLNAISDYIFDLTGIRSTIIRFPGGSSNTVSWFNRGIMTTLTQSVQEKGYHYFDWNVSSGDTAYGNTETSIFNNVINGIKVGRANCVLMHDGPNHKNSALALPHILEYLKSINAVYLPLTMDSPQFHQKVAN